MLDGEPDEIVALTDAELIAEANELARSFYKLYGYDSPKGKRFDQATHPQEQAMWNLVVLAYEFIEGTDLNDALASLEDED